MLLGALVTTLAVWVAFLARIGAYPDNHVSVEPLLAAAPFVVLLALAWHPRYAGWCRARRVVVAYAALSLLALVAADRANVLLSYSRWISRGMPERPCGPIARNLWPCHPER